MGPHSVSVPCTAVMDPIPAVAIVGVRFQVASTLHSAADMAARWPGRQYLTGFGGLPNRRPAPASGRRSTPCRPGPSRPSANLAREGRFDYLHLESTGISEPLPAAAPRLGRQTALTFPLLPPPYVSSPSRGTATRSFLDDGSLFSIMLISCSGNSARGTPIGTAEAVPERRAVLRV
jgi:hypothetical protein